MGAPITLEAAKTGKVAAAEAEARKNNWNVMIVILDSGGHTVMSQRLTGNAIRASIRIAAGKARTALEFKRPTKRARRHDRGRRRRLRLLSGGVTAIEGGIPIVVDGKIVGSIGVSSDGAARRADRACRCGGGKVSFGRFVRRDIFRVEPLVQPEVRPQWHAYLRTSESKDTSNLLI